MITPSKEKFIELSKNGNLIPVSKELLADLKTPVGAFLNISKNSQYAYLLESVEGGEKWARYTFLGADPSIVIKTSDKRGYKITSQGMEEFEIKDDPLAELKKVMSAYKPVGIDDMPPFFGGAVGYIGFDTVRFFEKLPEIAVKDVDVPDMVMMITDTLIAFDNVSQKIKVIVNAHIDNGDAGEAYDKAVKKIGEVVGQLYAEQAEVPAPQITKNNVVTKQSFGEEAYKHAVLKCKEYILEGDIFQVVLARRMEAKLGINPFEVYRILRTINPSPYLFYLKLDELVVVGASPEVLSKYQDGKVTVRPIAGTRPRGKTQEEDVAFEKELLADEKELAEHLMLIDLGRNDAGRVSKGGSVKVTEKMIVERYSHVMHIVSNVEGEIEEGKDCYDVIRATFPAGTLSGAPKIRAMEIIDELEPVRRGLYGGAVGYFGFNGNMDTCIAIRTMIAKDNIAYWGIGAGIVADSDPQKEFEETSNKGRAMQMAIKQAKAEEVG